jgi:hypothetical protein
MVKTVCMSKLKDAKIVVTRQINSYDTTNVLNFLNTKDVDLYCMTTLAADQWFLLQNPDISAFSFRCQSISSSHPLFLITSHKIIFMGKFSKASIVTYMIVSVIFMSLIAYFLRPYL